MNNYINGYINNDLANELQFNYDKLPQKFFSSRPFGSEFIANWLGTTAHVSGKMPVGYALENYSKNPYGRNLNFVSEDKPVQQPTTPPTTSGATYDSQNHTCSDGKPPYFSWLWSKVVGLMNSQEELNRLQCNNQFDCNRFPTTCGNLKSDGEGTLGGGTNPFGGNPFGYDVNPGQFFDKYWVNIAVLAIGLVVLAIGLYMLLPRGVSEVIGAGIGSAVPGGGAVTKIAEKATGNG